MKKAKTLTTKQLDKAIDALWKVHGDRVTINIMDISKIYRDARTAYAASPTPEALEASVKESAVKYRVAM